MHVTLRYCGTNDSHGQKLLFEVFGNTIFLEGQQTNIRTN